MRPVHDILYDMRPGKAPGPCPFVQHGTEETGFEYQAVCPWCAEDVGDRIPSVPSFTYMWLLAQLKTLLATHMLACTGGGFKLRVYKTTVPLGTDVEPKVM